MQQIAQSAVTNSIGKAIAEPARRGMKSGRAKMIDCLASQCDYCRSPIASGQRWVREKIYDPGLNNFGPSYHCYHAEPFEAARKLLGKTRNGTGNGANHRLRRLEVHSEQWRFERLRQLRWRRHRRKVLKGSSILCSRCRSRGWRRANFCFASTNFR
jgi:hypothetical protein